MHSYYSAVLFSRLKVVQDSRSPNRSRAAVQVSVDVESGLFGAAIAVEIAEFGGKVD